MSAASKDSAARFILGVDFLLQRVDGRGHLRHAVGRLLGKVLQRAELGIDCRLQALHHVHELLDL